MVKQIEESTREQAQSKIWFQQRAGRVTASQLKAAVVTNTAQPSTNVSNQRLQLMVANMKNKYTGSMNALQPLSILIFLFLNVD